MNILKLTALLGLALNILPAQDAQFWKDQATAANERSVMFLEKNAETLEASAEYLRTVCKTKDCGDFAKRIDTSAKQNRTTAAEYKALLAKAKKAE